MHERDRFSWTEQKTHAASLEEKKLKKIDMDFKMNQIKQVICLKITGTFRHKREKADRSMYYNKTLYVGFYNFGRCVKQEGGYVSPHQVSLRVSKGIQARIAVEEMQKNGGYRCITLKAFDSKGGDFVENPECTMVLVDNSTQTVLAESGKDSRLSSPDGFFKRIEIGVNNYDPQQFLN